LNVQAIKDFIGQGDAWIVRLYDQSGQGLDAKQDEYDKQPKIAEQGRLITDPDKKHVSIRFDGNQYLDTAYEPTESDVQASGMEIVASYGTIDSNAVLKKQGGSVQTYGQWTMDARVQTLYPIPELPEGHDTVSFRSYLLSSDTILYTTASKTFGKLQAATDSSDGYPSSPSIINSVTSTQSPLGIPSLTASVIPLEIDETSDRFSDIVDLGNGWLLAVPFAEKKTILINKATKSYRVLKEYIAGSNYYKGMFSKGIVYNGYVYLIPYNYTKIVQYEISTLLSTVNEVEKVVTTSENIGLFKDAVLASNSCIYCIPFNAGSVYKIDTTDFSNKSNALNFTGNASAGSKFYTGAEVVGKKRIVCPPYHGACVLEIDFNGTTETVNVLGNTGGILQFGPSLYYNEEMTKVRYGGNGYTANIETNSTIYACQSQSDGTGSTPFTCDAEIEYTQVVDSIRLTNAGGSGYVRNPRVRFVTDYRHWTRVPTASVTRLSGGKIVQTNIQIDDAGEGYSLNNTPIPIVFENGKGTKAKASAYHDPNTGAIRYIQIDQEGSGYIDAPEVVFRGGGGTGAEASTTIDRDTGRIIGINLHPINKGSGYVDDPEVELVGGQGTDATAVADLSIDGRIVKINVIDPGEGYNALDFDQEMAWTKQDWVAGRVTSPFITIGDGNDLHKGGKQAFAKVVALDESNGGILKVEVVYTGRGYKRQPTVTFRNDVTRQATGTADFKLDGRLSNIQMTQLGTKYLQERAVTIQTRQPTEEANDGNIAAVHLRLDGALNLTDTYGYTYLLDGREKFKSCVYHDGSVLAFPYNTYRILKMYYDASNNLKLEHMFVNGETDFGVTPNKYNAGIVSSGTCYVLPEMAQKVLRISSGQVNYVKDDNGDTIFQGQWNGGVLSSQDQVIYAIPRNSDYILAIDTKQDTSTNRVLFPSVASSRGPNKFSSIIEGSDNILYASPQDAEGILELDPGSASNQFTIPAPGVLQGSLLVFPPSGTTITVYNTSTLASTSYTLLDTSGNPVVIDWALGDGCAVGTNEVAFVSFYSARKAIKNKVVFYNTSTNRITHISNELDTLYLSPYPSSCVANLSGNIIWVPYKGNHHIVSYNRSTLDFAMYGTRPSPSARYASGETSGSQYTAIVPRETLLTTKTNVPEFNVYTGGRKFEDTVVTQDGLIVTVPSRLSKFTIFADETLTSHENIDLTLDSYVNGNIFGAAVVSSINNRVYCAPHDYNKFVALDTKFKYYSQYDTIYETQSKLYRGLVEDGGGSGLMYAIPWSATKIAIIDPFATKKTDVIVYMDDLYIEGEEKEAQWWGGVYSSMKKVIYAAPYDAETILVIRPEDSSWTELQPAGLNFTQKEKWSKGCLGPDQRIYFAPWNRDTILVIDPRDESVLEIPVPVLGPEKFSNIILGENNNLYLVPYGHRSFLEFNVRTGRFSSYGDLKGALPQQTTEIMASTLIPKTKQILAFRDKAAEVHFIDPRIQHLLFFDGSTVTVGSRVNTSTEFWLRPQRDSDGLVFMSLDTVVRVPDGASEASMSSQIIPGVAAVHQNGVITSSNDWKTSYVIPDEGGVCGALSFSKKADFLSGYRGSSYYCRMGDTTSFVPNLFESVFTNGRVGSFGSLSDSERMYMYFENNFVNRSSYKSYGDSGSTFSIGRIYGQGFDTVEVPEVSTTLNGYLSECLVFKNDVLSQSTRFGSDQTFYFKKTENFSL
jgi:hypothetical protein